MTWSQVKKMDRSPYAEIGVHSKTHRMLSSLSDDDLLSEIQDSKICIEQQLDRQVDLFAFPNGQGDDMPAKALEMLKKHKAIKVAVQLSGAPPKSLSKVMC